MNQRAHVPGRVSQHDSPFGESGGWAFVAASLQVHGSESTTGCSQRTARRDTCLRCAHWTQRRQPTATTGCIARATRGARRHTCLHGAHCWREVSRLRRRLGGCTPRTARATRVAETPACMVHTEDEPVAYDRCTTYISSSDTCLHGAHWQSTATTGCAARAT